MVDKQTAEEKKTLNANKTAKKESKKSLKQAGRFLTKNSTLKSPDVSKKEKKQIKKAVKNGNEVNLSYFKEGSKAYNAAVKYNEALKANKKAAYDCSAAQQEYNSRLVEASKIKFDNIADDYDKRIQMLNYQMAALDNRISEIETSGAKVSKSYYESQKSVNAQQMAQYQAEKAALEESIKSIKQGTDEWYDAYDQIQQVSSSISDCVKETYELNNAINQLHFDLFDDVSDSIKRIITEQEFLQGLFAHEKTTDDKTGGLTEAGIAKLGSLSASYYASKNNEERDAAEVKELQRMFDSKSLHSDLLGITFNSMEDLKKKLDEMYTKWQDDIKDTYDIASKISDLMKEKYQAELDMLKELIDAKKESLDAEKDLHDYQRTLTEKTKDISTIQKQIAAYSGDTSQEGQAKLQKLQKELSEKEDDLRETEYDRYISDQKDMLDKLYEEYAEVMEKKLDDFMELVREGLEMANGNMAVIEEYMRKISEETGYTLEMKGLFQGLGDGIKDAVLQAVSKIESDAGDKNGAGNNPKTQPSQNSSPKPPDLSSIESKLPLPGVSQERDKGDIENGQHLIDLSNASLKENAKAYVKARLNKKKKAGKPKKEYSDVNQRIYENKGSVYSGSGKVLSKDETESLAKKLGVKYDGEEKSGNLYKKLKSIKFPGFKKGGVVSVDDIEKQVKQNGDDGIASVKNGESILTPAQTEMLKNFIEKMPDLKMESPYGIETPIPMTDYLERLNPISNADRSGTTNIGNVSCTFELPNVIDEKSFINTMQNSQKVQKCIKSFTIEQLANVGKYDYKKIK